jgi:F-type H+-transporting ATPase subunit gamma
MANLKEIRNRITSVSSMSQITNAMKMVSAAKFKKAQDAIVQLRPYAVKLQEILSTLSNSDGNSSDNPYAKSANPSKKILFVVITSNRGLCGAFNSNLIKYALSSVNDRFGEHLANSQVTFLPIGRKASDYFIKRKYNVLPGNYNHLNDAPNFEKILPVARQIIDLFLDGSFGHIEIVYNQFKNAAVQIPTPEQFLPIPKPSVRKGKGDIKVKHYDFIFEPTKEYIIKELISRSLRVQILKALLDSVASEHGARMTAMHKATDNATELVKEYRLQYNKGRQASITNEILEIVGGAEALK